MSEISKTILLAVIAGLLLALVAGGITGNVVSVRKATTGNVNVYTATEIDTRLANCEMRIVSSAISNSNCKTICASLRKVRVGAFSSIWYAPMNPTDGTYTNKFFSYLAIGSEAENLFKSCGSTWGQCSQGAIAYVNGIDSTAHLKDINELSIETKCICC